MPPWDDNPLGFWESSAFYEFHERFLRTGQSSWDHWTAFRTHAQDDKTGPDLGHELRALLQQEFDDASLFVIKDPRICRFVPFWLDQLSAADVDALPVLITRSPVEVARSLAARDGLGLEHGLLLWLRHVLDAERDTRTVTRSMLSYEELLDNWRAVAERIAADFRMAWPVAVESAGAQIEDYLRPALRHHTESLDRLNVPRPLAEWVVETHRALALLRDGGAEGRSRATDTLDEVRQAFEDATDVFEAAKRTEFRLDERVPERLESARVEAQRRSERLAAECEELAQRLSQTELQLDVARERVLRAEASRDELVERVQNLSGDLVKVEADFTIEIQILSGRLENAEAHLDRLHQSKSWRWTAVFRSVVTIWRLAWSRVFGE